MKAGYVFENAELHAYPALFSCECIERSNRLKEECRDQETHQVIFETVLPGEALPSALTSFPMVSRKR